jgi:hypothetical protein
VTDGWSLVDSIELLLAESAAWGYCYLSGVHVSYGEGGEEDKNG